MPAAGFILSIDQGTTNTKAALIDKDCVPIFRACMPVPLLQPQAGFVEQDAQELWLSVRSVVEQCAAHAQQLDSSIDGIAISNQRETAVAWSQTPGAAPAALGRAISWQCRRSATICDRLAAHHGTIQKSSGLPVDPLLTAGKWAWMLENQPSIASAAKDGSLRLGNMDAWLLACLTNGSAHATDYTNASRTALLDLATLQWSADLCGIFAIPPSVLPRIQPSACQFGVCTAIAGLQGVPIVAMIGDSHAAMVGHGSYVQGSVKATYGTGSSLMTLTADLPAESSTLARTIAWAIGNDVQFALEGNIAMAGAAVQWVGEFLGLPNPASAASALAESVPDSAGMYFVPAMVGLGAPFWNASARGNISHIERFHTAAHLARAAVEAIAYQVADVFTAMEKEAGITLPSLRADGGATRNNSLMQFQSDILGRPVLRSMNEDLSLLGAAALGGLTLGWWASLADFTSRPGTAQTFESSISEAERKHLRDGWHRAVGRTLSATEEVTA